MRRSRRGFTLVEMLIVVSVIALLLGLTLPALITSRSYAEIAVCASNMNQITKGMLAYTNSSNGSLPGNLNDRGPGGVDDESATAIWIEGTGSSPWNSTKQTLHGAMAVYLEGNKRVFQCPTYKGQDELGGDSTILHYAIPTVLSGMPAGYAHSSYFHEPVTSTAEADRHRFASVPMVVEPLVRKEDDGSITNYLGTYVPASGAWSTLPDGAWEQGDKLATRRHLGKCNVAFVDSHVELVDFPDEEIVAQNIYMVIQHGDEGSLTKTLDMGATNVFDSWFNR